MTIKNIAKGILSVALATGLGAGIASAAHGTVDRDNGIVYITGDDWVDDCQVYVDGNEIEIELRVYDADGDLDDVDTRDYDIDDVDLIVFQGFSGDDQFWNSTPIPCVAYGGDGNDVLLGGWGDDDLRGGNGDDFLAGRSGDDDLYGDAGSDYLYGNSGDDYLKAGTGEDEYVIAGQSGHDTFAVPATYSWWTQQFYPVQRNVGYEDFNAQQDEEVLFWVPTLYTVALPTRF